MLLVTSLFVYLRLSPCKLLWLFSWREKWMAKFYCVFTIYFCGRCLAKAAFPNSLYKLELSHIAFSALFRLIVQPYILKLKADHYKRIVTKRLSISKQKNLTSTVQRVEFLPRRFLSILTFSPGFSSSLPLLVEGVSSPRPHTRTKSSLLRVDTESEDTLIFPTEALSSMTAKSSQTRSWMAV